MDAQEYAQTIGNVVNQTVALFAANYDWSAEDIDPATMLGQFAQALLVAFDNAGLKIERK